MSAADPAAASAIYFALARGLLLLALLEAAFYSIFSSALVQSTPSFVGYRLYTLLATSALGLAFGAVAFYADYRAWLDFADGAPPGACDFRSFTLFRVVQLYLWLVGNNVRDAQRLRAHPDKRCFLKHKLSPRPGSRPKMVHWYVPQRVRPPVDHVPSVEVAIRSILNACSEKNHSQNHGVYMGTSKIEGKGDCISIDPSISGINSDIADMYREVAHIHNQDLSFHTLLAPADAAEVVEKGWGERFALAGRRAWGGRKAGYVLPHGMILMYPPASLEEVEVVKEILQAGVRHALAGDAVTEDAAASESAS